MARNSPSGKGRGGFASSRTRRSRKAAVIRKSENRARNAANKAKAL
tara:strand:- start:1172 stop:1309 length:138 start_codon:yes stop_codon:yes gene_type:complete